MKIQAININSNINNRKSQKQSFKMKVDRDLFMKVVEEEVSFKKPFEEIFARLKDEFKILYENVHRPNLRENNLEINANKINFPTENKGKVSISLDKYNNLFYNDISGRSKKKREIIYTHNNFKIKQEIFPAGSKEIVNTSRYDFDESSKLFVEIPKAYTSVLR